MEMTVRLTPDKIMQFGMGFFASKTLLSAVELGVFSALSQGPQSLAQLTARLGLHGRGSADFFDALVAMGLLERVKGQYRNGPDAAFFLVRDRPTYIGGILEMANNRLYGFWGNLTEALRSGQQQNEAKFSVDPFPELYSDSERLRAFLQAMTGISQGAAHAMADKFPWHAYQTMADVGTAQGAVPIILAQVHPHLRCTGFDLPIVQPVFEEYVRSFNLQQRVTFQAGDFFKDPMPSADVIVMGHILHDWGLEDKTRLVQRAHDALPPGGALVVHESIIDDDRRQNLFGLLMSLNMLIETPAGFDFTGADCCEWMRAAGFVETRVEPLVGPDSMVVGIKAS